MQSNNEEKQENIPHPYKSKLATALCKALGESTLLQQLDELRLQLKSSSQSTRTACNLFASLKSTRMKNQECINTFEKHSKRNTFPQTEDCPTEETDREYAQLCKNARRFNNLLSCPDLVENNHMSVRV